LESACTVPMAFRYH
jgi:hypothetical protein